MTTRSPLRSVARSTAYDEGAMPVAMPATVPEPAPRPGRSAVPVARARGLVLGERQIQGAGPVRGLCRVVLGGVVEGRRGLDALAQRVTQPGRRGNVLTTVGEGDVQHHQ